MKIVFSIAFILFFVFTLQGYAQQSSGQHHGFPGVNQIILQYGEQLNLTFAELRCEGLNEMKEFLTIAEFENLQPLSSFRAHNRHTPARRFMLRSRRS